jgi:hypothetical protein
MKAQLIVGYYFTRIAHGEVIDAILLFDECNPKTTAFNKPRHERVIHKRWDGKQSDVNYIQPDDRAKYRAVYRELFSDILAMDVFACGRNYSFQIWNNSTDDLRLDILGISLYESDYGDIATCVENCHLQHMITDIQKNIFGGIEPSIFLFAGDR